MSFAADDLERLIRFLEEHPEQRGQLQRAIFPEESPATPPADRVSQSLEALAAAQLRTEKALEQLTSRVDSLAEKLEQLTSRVDSLAEKLEQLTSRVDSLAEKLEQLTSRVDSLAEAQQRTELRLEMLVVSVEQLTSRVDSLAEKLEQLTSRVDSLAEKLEQLTSRVDSLAEKLEQLTSRVDSLAEKLEQLTSRVDSLAEAQQRTELRLEMLVVSVDKLTHQVELIARDQPRIKGIVTEWDYRTKAHAYFAPIARRLRVLTSDELEDVLEEAVGRGGITEGDADDARRADIVLTGKSRESGEDVLVVVEASWRLDADDVRRAGDRAGAIGRSGRRTIAVVAGDESDDDVEVLATGRGVWVVRDGSAVAPKESAG